MQASEHSPEGQAAEHSPEEQAEPEREQAQAAHGVGRLKPGAVPLVRVQPALPSQQAVQRVRVQRVRVQLAQLQPVVRDQQVFEPEPSRKEEEAKRARIQEGACELSGIRSSMEDSPRRARHQPFGQGGAVSWLAA